MTEGPLKISNIKLTSYESSLPATTIEPKVIRPATSGSLDELSLPILKLKVRCWCGEICKQFS